MSLSFSWAVKDTRKGSLKGIYKRFRRDKGFGLSVGFWGQSVEGLGLGFGFLVGCKFLGL